MIGVVVCGINVASDFQNIKLFLLFAKPGTFAEYFVVSKVKLVMLIVPFHLN